MTRADRPAAPSARERALKKIAAWMTLLLYRSVEVHEQYEATASGPQLGVSNHFGGFADPLILAHALDRVPRFIARDVIWRYPLAKQVMEFARAIPVHKREDKGPKGNDQMFRSTYAALAEGDLVVIFPEGITVDDPSIAPIKTGAARIALGAHVNGVSGIEIVPIGIHYEDKATLRSKVFVYVGEPLDLDAEIAAHTGREAALTDRDSVDDLTEAIEERLRRAAPDFTDWREARALNRAAAVSIRSAEGMESEVDYGDQSRLAAMLAQSPRGGKQVVIDAMDVYAEDLDAVGVDDAEMVDSLESGWSFTVRLLWNIILGILLIPFAAIGLLINALPMALLWLVGRIKAAPAMMATVKPLAAMVLFGITWAVFIWRVATAGALGGSAIWVVLLPLYLFALLAVVERVQLIWRALSGWVRSRRSGLRVVILEHRRDVVESVADAL
jgi:1-acyl-sn-glycerol-3-phosphate acyltransferase